jgi:cell division septation protein DedD
MFAPARAQESAVIEGLDLSGDSLGIRLDKRAQYEAAFLNDPPRVVIDFLWTKSAGASAIGTGSIIQAVQASRNEGDPPVARVVVELYKPAGYSIAWSGDSKLVLSMLGAPPAQAPAPAEPPAEEKPSEPLPLPGTSKPAAVETTAVVLPRPEPERGPRPPRWVFEVQAASFRREADALRLREALQGIGGEVSVVRVSVGGKDFFRVMAGPFPDRGRAQAAAAKAKEAAQVDALVVKTRPRN